MPSVDGNPVIGVLGIQGSIVEHVAALKACGVGVVEVLTAANLDTVDGLILPGGESSTISKLMKVNGLDEAIRKRVAAGMPVYGTCAGLILLGQTEDAEMTPLKLMDIEVERNAYGRQRDSFICEVDAELNGQIESVPAVFIRAPQIRNVGEGVKVLAKHEEKPILCQQDKLLVSSFHPELTEDLRVHQYFIDLCCS